jgi:FtsP/CotA-like multicopper oxidase with cupredoxin domain
MSGSHHHHEHGKSGHGHGPVTHAAPADAIAAYTQAYEAVVPQADRAVVEVELEPSEFDWEFTPASGAGRGASTAKVLEVNGEPPAFRSWEDTVNVPPKARVRIAWMPDDRPGEWMYHCHILEHHQSGMMAHFEVIR